jgi:hypothetical protein
MRAGFPHVVLSRQVSHSLQIKFLHTLAGGGRRRSRRFALEGGGLAQVEGGSRLRLAQGEVGAGGGGHRPACSAPLPLMAGPTGQRTNLPLPVRAGRAAAID